MIKLADLSIFKDNFNSSMTLFNSIKLLKLTDIALEECILTLLTSLLLTALL